MQKVNCTQCGHRLSSLSCSNFLLYWKCIGEKNRLFILYWNCISKIWNNDYCIGIVLFPKSPYWSTLLYCSLNLKVTFISPFFLTLFSRVFCRQINIFAQSYFSFRWLMDKVRYIVSRNKLLKKKTLVSSSYIFILYMYVCVFLILGCYIICQMGAPAT